MLKDSLQALNVAADRTEQCRLFTIAKDLDPETRQVFIRALLNRKVSSRQLHSTLRAEGIVIDKGILNKQRQCMIQNDCVCRWDEISS